MNDALFAAALVLLTTLACAEDAGSPTPTDSTAEAGMDTVAETSPDAPSPDTPSPDAPNDAIEDGALDAPDPTPGDVAAPSDAITDAGPADVADDVAFTLPADLNGEMPSGGFQSLASFSAVVDHTGTPVGADDVVGQWTVMWFYTLASTSG